MMAKEVMFCTSFLYSDVSHIDCLIPDNLGSTKLDAEKRLALQEEKQALEAKLLEV